MDIFSSFVKNFELNIMNIKKFLESLTINEYNDLEDIIITRLKKQEEKEDDSQSFEINIKPKKYNSKRIKITDFMEKHKSEIPLKVFWALRFYSEKSIYLDKLNREKIIQYKGMGKHFITFLDKIMEAGGYDTKNYYKGM